MASGLVALLDDVAGIAKIAATSLDDMAGAAGKAGAKTAGVVVDDAAVTPSYAMGFTPDRELPIVWKIALGSLRNKFLLLLPGALALSAFAPWALTPLLMLGGAYLCLEAAEKLVEIFVKHEPGDEPADLALNSRELEAQKVKGAIRTDLILSAEIMAIALADVADRPLPVQAGALALVSLMMTAGVYGAVGLLVKMDDIGLHLAEGRRALGRSLGRGLVRGMPVVLHMLGGIGTAAMLWVGGGIIVHGLHHFGLDHVPDLVEAAKAAGRTVPFAGPVVGWAAGAVASGLTGLALGAFLIPLARLLHRSH